MSALEVEGLRISFRGTVLVDGVSFGVESGQRTCLLGASGSGKSLIARAVVGQLPAGMRVTGSIRINGVEVAGMTTAKRPDEARAAMIFQDSAVALNPLVRVRDQLASPLRRRRALSRTEAVRASAGLVEAVGLPAALLEAFPQELSGGQRQRVCIALALTCEAGLLVADEPTTALDVVTQARVLKVLRERADATPNLGMLFITHDIAVAAAVCSQAVVIAGGHVVEQGRLDELISRPEAAPTRSLVHAAHTASLNPSPLAHPAAARPAKARPVSRPEGDPAFFELRGVSKAYAGARRSPAPRPALTKTDLVIGTSERVGIVGVSGSGKTTLLRLMLALEGCTTGVVRCGGRDVRPADARSLRWYRRQVQYVPQDPANTLDPLMKVEDLVAEPLVALGSDIDRRAAVLDALESVGLDRAFLGRRRHELSGGQAQRVAIARAIVTRPAFLLADEPVSGVDPATRERIVALLAAIAEERGTGLLVVSHDLSVVAGLCERTLVMHAGRVIEDRPTPEVLDAPGHECTRELMAAVPALPALAI